MSDYAAHSPETSRRPPAGPGAAATPPHGDTLTPTRGGAVFCSFHGSRAKDDKAAVTKKAPRQEH